VVKFARHGPSPGDVGKCNHLGVICAQIPTLCHSPGSWGLRWESGDPGVAESVSSTPRVLGSFLCEMSETPAAAGASASVDLWRNVSSATWSGNLSPTLINSRAPSPMPRWARRTCAPASPRRPCQAYSARGRGQSCTVRGAVRSRRLVGSVVIEAAACSVGGAVGPRACRPTERESGETLLPSCHLTGSPGGTNGTQPQHDHHGRERVPDVSAGQLTREKVGRRVPDKVKRHWPGATRRARWSWWSSR